jgi:hypothetical protein
MARDKRIQVRLNNQEWEKLYAEAQRREMGMSEVLRDYIKNLPSSNGETTSTTQQDIT